MPIEAVLKNATGLSDRDVDMVVSYIRFLQSRSESGKNGQARRTLAPLADKFHSIAPDFDETPEIYGCKKSAHGL